MRFTSFLFAQGRKVRQIIPERKIGGCSYLIRITDWRKANARKSRNETWKKHRQQYLKQKKHRYYIFMEEKDKDRREEL